MSHPTTIDAKATKALLVKALKESFPITKFSVKVDGYKRAEISWAGGPSEGAIENISAWFELPCSDYESLSYDREPQPLTMIDGEAFITEFHYISLRRAGESWSDRDEDDIPKFSPVLESLVEWDGEEEFADLRARLDQVRAKKLAVELGAMIKAPAARARAMAL